VGKSTIEFEVWGKVPSKSNFRWSPGDPKSRQRWREIKNYESTVGNAAMAAGARYGRIPKAVALEVTVVNQRLDLDNCLKCPVDGIKGVVIPDDTPRWIPDIRILHEKTPDGEPRVRYRIRYLGCREEAA
jgi:Holliday junction resolvase RusA-like endonuclease